MPRKKKSDYDPHISADHAPACHVAGCVEHGVYKAPKSRQALHDYVWFCLEHVREHNRSWDYFSGMDSEQIEAFLKDAVTGHRPTWSRESRIRDHYRELQDRLYEFLYSTKAPAPSPQLPAKIRKALAALDMSYPYSGRELKTRYRALVKKYHPDVNRQNKEAEEIFKKISAAYHALADDLKNGKSY